MGNGKIQNIKDVIYVMPEKFDNTKTVEMKNEIDALNQKMQEAGNNMCLLVRAVGEHETGLLEFRLPGPKFLMRKLLLK